MCIEQELIAQLQSAMPVGPRQRRNIHAVLHYYGFAGGVWPTLEETAAAVGLGTRERVRQILHEALMALTRGARLPALHTASRLIRSRPLWTDKQLAAKLAERTGTSAEICVRGLLSLLHDLRLARGYGTYDHNLARLTRGQLAANRGFVLVRNDALPSLEWGLIGARRLSLRLGLVCENRLAEAFGADVPLEPLKTLLMADPACCAWYSDEALWWALETRENVLVGMTAKAFTAARTVTPARLADALSNALKARVGRERHAGRAEVEAWIGRSRWFQRVEGRLVFLGQPAELTSVERELVAYLSARGEADYRAIKAHMRTRGVQASMSAKTATQSPIVHIDRSGGTRSYRYSLIGHDPAAAAQQEQMERPGGSAAPRSLH